MSYIRLPPFEVGDQLVNDIESDDLALEYPVEDYLATEFDTQTLDELGTSLNAVTKQFGIQIDAIHQHVMKQRALTIAEDPRLHLIWYYNTVYLKPIPPYLLNYNFWQHHLLVGASCNASNPDEYDMETLSRTCKSTLGFLRSYSYLILHRSDLKLAESAYLLPEGVKYSSFRRFIKSFRELPDQVVSPRYRFGQIRLTRLNWAIRLLQPGSKSYNLSFNYQRKYWQTGQYLECFIAPALFTFAAISLILSSMQVVLTALGEDTWTTFMITSWTTSIAVMIIVPLIAGCVLFGVGFSYVAQAAHALYIIFKDNRLAG